MARGATPGGSGGKPRMNIPSARAFAAFLLAAFVLAALGACSRAGVFHREGYVFGTRVDLSVYGADPAQADAAMAAVLREFDRLHRAWHAWEPSELTALNEALARGETAAVSGELAAALRDAQRLAAAGGAQDDAQNSELFNPALGALIALWGFHSDTFAPRLPDPGELQRLREARPRMADLVINGDRVVSRNPAVRLDLGGYAKGYALDRAAAILRAADIRDALINIGGNVMALGRKGEQPWRVGIQDPREPGPLAALPLYDGEAIGTSGDYQRYFELEGVRYAHLLDPRSGAPARGTRSLTVLVTPRGGADSGAGVLSDVASKPAYIAGDAWREQTRRFGISHALRVAADGRIEVTQALRARLQFLSDGAVTVVE